ncbi:glutamate racemase [Sandaracinobacteroides saxicola]|uniref:Glutamate racemase n=1 Tax=Sandaracinobacteroides saxicola TaxID=2759707 RepID=A0A7G5IGX2_9SPHN|nr:glutamate racemase [Sandaracinobacteroides saxicola]QMW22614.1 glutamate racemase [Sandaracinobacteroides saxicola]
MLLFDSGIGGLSVLREVTRALPQAPLVYAADTAGFPYGVKSEMEVATRVSAWLGRLAERLRPSLVVIACNTASVIALAHVRAVLDVGVVGTVPAIKPAAEASVSRVIGVLGTPSTVRQPYVDALSARFAADCTVLRHGSSALVALAEAHLRGEATADADYRAALEGLLMQPGGDAMDVVVLACTHFPLVAERLAAVAPRPLRFVDGAAGIARRTAHLLAGRHWPAPGGHRAIATGAVPGLERYAPALKAFGLPPFEVF